MRAGASRLLSLRMPRWKLKPWVCELSQLSRSLGSISAMKQPEMMCFQCEQTSAGKGCTTQGVCSKTPQLSGLQDLQVAYMKRLCQLSHALGPCNPLFEESAALLLESCFATLTNVNFDDDRFESYLSQSASLASRLEQALGSAVPPKPVELPEKLPKDRHAIMALAGKTGLLFRGAMVGNDDVFGVLEMATYGLKGCGAYLYHAEQLGGSVCGAYSQEERKEVFLEFFRLGSYLASAGSSAPQDSEAALQQGLQESLAVGALNLKIMKLLDSAHCEVLGTPTPTEVPTAPVPGQHAILVSGHDLGILHQLLKHTEDKGIHVYTHGEMLPAHGYPGLQKFSHLKGHFGTHWGNQLHEFRRFPGSILMTSNCLRPPTKKYADRIWTAGPVGFPGVPHIEGDHFESLVDRAGALPGFVGDELPFPQLGKCITGFGHNAVLGVADTIVNAVKSGELNHIFVVGGCDGTETARSYFTDFAESTPSDSIILTLGCGKFRLMGTDHGTLAGLPRLLDLGQCNDAYSGLVIAQKLSEALGCKVNELPLHFAVSWFEQKAVAVLLTLLHLELKNIRIGPAVPAFLTPRVAEILHDKFGLQGIRADREDEDLKDMLTGS